MIPLKPRVSSANGVWYCEFLDTEILAFTLDELFVGIRELMNTRGLIYH